jgi:Ribbon-helix-helix protein, copG family
MATKDARIDLHLPRPLKKDLAELARREHLSTTTLIRIFIHQGIAHAKVTAIIPAIPMQIEETAMV